MAWHDERIVDTALNPARDVWATRLSASSAQVSQPLVSADIVANMALFHLPKVAVAPKFSEAVAEYWSIAINPDPTRMSAESALQQNVRSFSSVRESRLAYRNTSAISYVHAVQAFIRQDFDYTW